MALLVMGDVSTMWLLATAGDDRVVEVWNIHELTTPWSLLYGHDAEIKTVFMAEQPGLVFACSQDGTIRTWNLLAQRLAPKGNPTQLMNELPKWVT